ncbi:hypothetical protein ISN44_As06g043270 [Arabidopsis suecica]|uniref:Uncharacterized protein n=1 Tax=Arabidopsis suecica TaxID=45249 RepID=A0A8T2CRE1_ARASU|nr:hypothetical protein ISN44_As06g043270 [Arabidopsis suecica]
MSCIGLCGDKGIEVIENIKSDPCLALACVMKRVKQKQEEWRTCLSEFKEPWSEVYAKNFQKSLDHKTYDKEKSKESYKPKTQESKGKNKSKDKGKAEAESRAKNKSKEKVEKVDSHEDEKQDKGMIQEDGVIRKSARKIKPNQKYL